MLRVGSRLIILLWLMLGPGTEATGQTENPPPEIEQTIQWDADLSDYGVFLSTDEVESLTEEISRNQRLKQFPQRWMDNGVFIQLPDQIEPSGRSDVISEAYLINQGEPVITKMDRPYTPIDLDEFTGTIRLLDNDRSLMIRTNPVPLMKHAFVSEDLESLELQVPMESGLVSNQFLRTGITLLSDDVTQWEGVNSDGTEFARLSATEYGLSGTLLTQDGDFEIIPLSPTVSSITEITPLADHPDDFESLVPINAVDETRTSSGSHELGVLVVYTSDARYGDRRHRRNPTACQAMSELQAALDGSGAADIVIQPRILLELDERDFGDDIGTIRNVLVSSGDGIYDDVHKVRQAHDIDLVVLLVEKSDKCGLAVASPAIRPEEGFAVVKRECAMNYRSFAHEIGHLLGACHENISRCNRNRTSARARISDNRKWSTLMAIRKNCNHCNRLIYFSNQLIDYMGINVGSMSQDNIRAINQNIESVSGLGEQLPSSVVSENLSGKIRTCD